MNSGKLYIISVRRAGRRTKETKSMKGGGRAKDGMREEARNKNGWSWGARLKNYKGLWLIT